MDNNKIISILDRIAHPSTSDIDVMQSVFGLRRVLKGELPSNCLGKQIRVRPQKHRSYQAWQDEIDELKEQLAEKTETERTQEKRVKSLTQEVEKLQAQVLKLKAAKPKEPKETKETKSSAVEFYTNAQFAAIMVERVGKYNGAKRAFEDFNTELRKKNPELGVITSSHLEKWRVEDRYPTWVIEQLRMMSKADLPTSSHRWTQADKDFLRDLYRANPTVSDRRLAEILSERFGCDMTENAVKGALDRLRRKGEIERRK